MKFQATKRRVKDKVVDKGSPPDEFLAEAVMFGRSAPDEIFAPRKDDEGETDIYTAVAPYLSPWKSLLHRKASMLEILRILGAFESEWNWTEGRDVSNPKETDSETISAGVFQVSYNSRVYGKDLRQMLVTYGIQDGEKFQRAMKRDHQFAFEYTARLLRHTIRHHGPTKRRQDTAKYHDSIYSRLRRDAVEEFELLISSVPVLG